VFPAGRRTVSVRLARHGPTRPDLRGHSARLVPNQPALELVGYAVQPKRRDLVIQRPNLVRRFLHINDAGPESKQDRFSSQVHHLQATAFSTRYANLDATSVVAATPAPWCAKSLDVQRHFAHSIPTQKTIWGGVFSGDWPSAQQPRKTTRHAWAGIWQDATSKLAKLYRQTPRASAPWSITPNRELD